MPLTNVFLKSFFCLALFVAPNYAQENPAISALIETTVNEKSKILIPEGIEIKITPVDVIISREVFEGDPVTFKVLEDVKIKDKIVIAKNTLVNGIVTASKEAKGFGLGGKLTVSVESTETVDGETIRLRGTESVNGKSKKKSWALIPLLGVIGAATAHEVRGGDARIIPGEILKAFTGEAKTVIVKD